MYIKYYDYLFYKLFLWSVKVNGVDYYNKYSATLMITLVLFINIITVIVVISNITGFVIVWGDIPKYIIVLMAIGLGLLNYSYFSFNDRSSKIVRRFNNENNINAKYGNIIVTVYVIGSFLLLFISGLTFK